MLLDIVLQFIMELVRTLLIEELCRRVRRVRAQMAERRRRRRLIQRVLHTLPTGRQDS